MKILHLADIHIHNTERHEEYNKIFEKLYKKIKNNNIDIVAIIGDTVDNFIDISNEAKIIAGNFLNNLSKYTKKIVIVVGNHDIRKKNLNRINSVKTIVKLINNPKITYYDKSGFYIDNIFTNIIWVNHSHMEKNINPWKNIQHKRDNTKIYIDLFHDPINGGKSDNGLIFKDNNYRNLSDFKGDLVFLGDLHQRQFFRKNKTAAYCSSLIQQKFSETVDNHGGIIWEISNDKNITSKSIDITNDHTKNNLYINEGFDYDNIKIESKERVGKYPEFKVNWKDLSSNINTNNERKIRKYIKDKWGDLKIKFDKTYIYTDIVSSKMLSETLDLSNKISQRKIFNEYLEEQGYKKKEIIDILKIDDIINNRLELREEKTNIEWKIDNFWFDNFKVFGDKNKIDWSDLNGIIQIHGENQQGKTTILDAITYILYGTTLTTDSSGGGKREKFGDNRFINNKRNLNKCSGGAVLDINGEKITILRKTERILKRNGEIKSCSTNLDFYDSEEIKEKNKLTGERRTKTQKKLDMILGDFVDFVRISLTNADNLNEILSSNRSVFIDSIIRDAGYDIFDKKQNEFKEYKKEQNIEKIIINITESENEIEKIKNELKNKKEEIKDKKKLISNYEEELKNKNIDRDNFIKKLNKIDESMISFDIDLSTDTLNNYIKKIEDSKIQICIYEKEIVELPFKFDPSKLERLKVKLKETNTKISKIKEEISTIRNNNTEINSKIDKVKQKLRELRDKEIQKFKDQITQLEINISNIKQEKKNIIDYKISKIKDQIKKVELEKINLENKVISLKKDGSVLKSRNDEKQKEVNELMGSNFCPTCGREFDESTPEHLEHIKQKIGKLNSEINFNNEKIKKLISEYKKLNPNILELKDSLIKLKDTKQKILNGEYDSETLLELEKVENTNNITQKIKITEELIDRLKNNDLSVNDELKSKFKKGKVILKKLDSNKKDNLIVISNLENELKSLNVESIEDDIYLQEKDKESYELRKEKFNLKEKLELNIDNYQLKITEINQNINKFKEYEEQIEENKNIQIDINNIDKEISESKKDISDEYDNISDIKKEIALKEKDVENINIRIEKFIQQKKQEELMKEYQRCISRDGIPTYLLKKSIHLINKEMNDLLSNVDFTLFFDENLTLKMSMDDRLDVSQNTIESSGKERTFCALALKIALRQINVKSRPNFIILDEIMGKLYEHSVIEFIDLLDEIKNKIDKIIIIEHVHPINYDGIITAKKGDNLISYLSTDF